MLDEELLRRSPCGEVAIERLQLLEVRKGRAPLEGPKIMALGRVVSKAGQEGSPRPLGSPRVAKLIQ